MNYKKIIRSQQFRLWILSHLSWISDDIILRIQYRIKMGFWPDFKHPKRFTEKLQLYKMKYRNPVMPVCVDKYDVRKYVESKGLGNILNRLYGVYDSFDEVDFVTLPNKFVIKTTDGGGGLNVIIVKDKNTCNFGNIREKMSIWGLGKEKKNESSPGREWAYTGIRKSRIIIEELLEDCHNADGSIEDYKFMCFNGHFKSLWIDKNRYTNHHRGFWDKNLIFLPNVYSDHDTFAIPPELPNNIEEMITVAEKLSEDFPYARVDLYNIDGRIVFGEITFYPWSGYVRFTPDEFDFELGSYFTEY